LYNPINDLSRKDESFTSFNETFLVPRPGTGMSNFSFKPNQKNQNKLIMKTNLIKLASLALLPAALLTFTSCSTTGGDETVTAVETPRGAIIVDTMTARATVTAIDAATREVTLTLPDGQRKIVKCGPAVANFSQIEVNDQVIVTITEELAVFLGTGAAPSATGAAGVVLAPIGARPGGVIAKTVEITAKVTAIDVAKRKVTLALPDDSTKTVKVGEQVNLAAVKIGDNVTVQHTESLAISVQKP